MFCSQYSQTRKLRWIWAVVQHVWNLQALGEAHWISVVHCVFGIGTAATHLVFEQICCPVQSLWFRHWAEIKNLNKFCKNNKWCNILWLVASVQHIWNLQAFDVGHWLSVLHWLPVTGIAAAQTPLEHICCPTHSLCDRHWAKTAIITELKIIQYTFQVWNLQYFVATKPANKFEICKRSVMYIGCHLHIVC